jgi:hypothetical protein
LPLLQAIFFLLALLFAPKRGLLQARGAGSRVLQVEVPGTGG